MNSFNVILTYNNFEQEIFDIIDFEISLEKPFIISILRELPLERLKDLVKISLCQVENCKYLLLDWLMARNGKYYFNTEVNDDEDTKSWNRFTNGLLSGLGINVNAMIRLTVTAFCFPSSLIMVFDYIFFMYLICSKYSIYICRSNSPF